MRMQRSVYLGRRKKKMGHTGEKGSLYGPGEIRGQVSHGDRRVGKGEP